VYTSQKVLNTVREVETKPVVKRPCGRPRKRPIKGAEDGEEVEIVDDSSSTSECESVVYVACMTRSMRVRYDLVFHYTMCSQSTIHYVVEKSFFRTSDQQYPEHWRPLEANFRTVNNMSYFRKICFQNIRLTKCRILGDSGSELQNHGWCARF
jgi:hypothetical protein